MNSEWDNDASDTVGENDPVSRLSCESTAGSGPHPRQSVNQRLVIAHSVRVRGNMMIRNNFSRVQMIKYFY